MGASSSDNINVSTFETEDLRENLAEFLRQEFDPKDGSIPRKVGGYRWGVYAFFDYDGEPIYVGQTKEQVSTRVRRHLTNQRTDAVAMSVLDPFEVCEIEVWPLPQFQNINATDVAAKAHLDALEYLVYQEAINASKFKAVLNEKKPPEPIMSVSKPKSFRYKLVSEAVFKIRSHPDFRIARRSLIISRLAQVISERRVPAGLRLVMLTQAKRLQWLANRRYDALEAQENEANKDN